MSINDDLGHTVYCRELNSRGFYTGTLLITEKEIIADLFAYEERYIDIDDRQPIHLQTQNLNVASLHSNVCVSSGTVFRRTNDLRLTGLYHSRFQSYLAVIGSSPWLRTDIVKSTYFKIDDADFMLNHLAKRDRIAGSKIANEVDRNLFSVNTAGLTIHAAYSATYSIAQPYPTKLCATLSIDFDSEQTLSSYLDHIVAVVQLFSASSGLPLRPTDVLVSRQSSSEFASKMAAEFAEPHYVRYIWPEVKYDKTMTWAGSSFLLSTDDEDLEGLKACLAAWMQRVPEWRKANALMMESLSLCNEISPVRFISACRWFEEIPLTRTKQVILDADIEAISSIASEKATELGYGKISARIAGSLRRVSDESQRERFERLLLDIRSRFGPAFLKEEPIIDDLMNAVRMRGQVAHGHFGANTDAEHRAIVRSLFAMEAFCFLLTVKDLPLNAKSRARVGGNPIMIHYRYAMPSQLIDE